MFFSNGKEFKETCGYEINGVWYPRVTKIVEIKSKPALYKFYAEVKGDGENIMKLSADECTRIHEAAEKILTGKSIDIDSSIRPAMEAFRQFIEEQAIEVRPEHIEQRITHPEHRYSGTTDALATINGKFGVLDFKTSQSIYRDYNLQTAAYMEAWLKRIPTLETRWIMRIDQTKICFSCGAKLRPKGGREKIRPARDMNNRAFPLCNNHEWSELQGEIELQEFPEWKKDFEAFLGAKRLWEWEYEYWLERVGYLVPTL